MSLHAKSGKPIELELLSPAKDIQTGMAAIVHGADAVYIGPQGFGARSAAANSTADIERLCEFAHPYGARVYATVNTLLKDSELKQAERLITDLYKAGVDAIIVQDMGVLRMDIPPIALHASTQCDTRTVEKAKFLEKAGFSQIVLARELTITQIREICDSVSVPVEAFIHGALCVSYSGRCFASLAACGRSANRGRCAQLCRLPYNLMDAKGHSIKENLHLLSLKDLNTTDILPDMVSAGVRSFKIEGRLKDIGYVKNITSVYSQLLDDIVANSDGKYTRSSYGEVRRAFTPDVYKSFNRGFTHYFLEQRRPQVSQASIYTPKSLGEPVTAYTHFSAGDGISWFAPNGEYTGVRVNRVEQGRPIFARGVKVPHGVQLWRTGDAAFQSQVTRPDSAVRLIGVKITLFENRAVIEDERGCKAVLPMPEHNHDARTPMEPRRYFEKLGGTIFVLKEFENHLDADSFIPASVLTELRRQLIATLQTAWAASYARPLRAKEQTDILYMSKELTATDNVSNHLSEDFYRSHGVQSIEPALDTLPDVRKIPAGTPLMTTRYCLLRELGMCKRICKDAKYSEPLRLVNPNGVSYTLKFDCAACEMQLLQE